MQPLLWPSCLASSAAHLYRKHEYSLFCFAHELITLKLTRVFSTLKRKKSSIRRRMRNEVLTGWACLAEAFYRQVQPSQLVRNVHKLLALSSCPSPASVFRSALPRLPCKFQPTMYPFIRRHHPCCKLQLRGELDESAFFFKVSTKFSRLCEWVTVVYRSFSCVSTFECSL